MFRWSRLVKHWAVLLLSALFLVIAPTTLGHADAGPTCELSKTSLRKGEVVTVTVKNVDPKNTSELK